MSLDRISELIKIEIGFNFLLLLVFLIFWTYSESAFLAVHHKTPGSRRGRSMLDNLITLCKECHAKKHPWLKSEQENE